jgi:hypothetical protein
MPPQQANYLLNFIDSTFGFGAHCVRMICARAVVKIPGAGESLFTRAFR